jgi:tryptophanyl-tRNA synthetase
MRSIILTGDRPTGPLHIGHFVGSLKNRVAFQDTYQQFLMIADTQALTDNFDQPQKVRDNVVQVALDYFAVGLDPKCSTFFIQSQIPELYELTSFFMNLVTVARVQRNPTIKEEIKQKGFDQSLPVGFLCYPISQAADILAFGADVVPVGADQNPMIEQANEIARRFNSIYGTNTFKEVKSIVGSIGRLPGIDGKAKMSKSLNNAIFLNDSTDAIRRKVNLMFTDPNHIKIEDPGTVEGNVVFQFLDFFDPDKVALEELRARYQRGGLGDGQLKKRLVEILDSLISPMRQRRQQYESNIPFVMATLREGTLDARAKVAKKVSEVRTALKLNY